MDTSFFTINYFLSESEFQKLFVHFYSYDSSEGYKALAKSYKSDLDIVVRWYDFDLEITRDLKENFYEDFVFKGLPNISKNHFLEFKKEIVDKGLYSVELKHGLAEAYLSATKKMKQKIDDADFLKDDLKKALINEISEFEGMLNAYIVNPYPEITRKLQFNMNRTDVEFFFYSLRANKIINPSMGDSELGRIIDNVCQWKSKAGYNDVKGSQGHLNDFVNTGGRPQGPAVKRLTKRLQSMLENL